MRIRWKLVVAGWAAAVLLAGGGCGSDSGANAGADNEAANAGGGAAAGRGEASSGQTGSPQTPSPDGTTGGSRAGVTAEQLRPAVQIETSMGRFTVELDPEQAPLTVDNFLRYVEKGFYDGTIFHQVHPGHVILGGMYTPELTEKETDLPVRNEAHNGLKNLRGTIAMFRQYDVPDSATCAFFVNVKDNPNYDHKPEVRETYSNLEDYGYCVFGKVTRGMDVVDQIGGVEVQDTADFERKPVQTVRISSARRIR